MNKNIVLVLISAFFIIVSCTARDKGSDLNYMQNIEQIATEEAIKNTASTLQVGDQLVILVTAKDMDVVKPFNQNYSSGEISQTSLPSSNMPTQGQTVISGPLYIIDSKNEIDFPVLGKLSTAGKTLVEFKDDLRSKLNEYIKNPSISIRITNYKVTILGEVTKPGQYVIPDGQTTLLNALGLAGDLTMYGKREDILIVRTENGHVEKARINILKADFIKSNYYNLKQGDVIYVSPNETKEKTAKLDPNMPIYISVAGIVVTILALVFKK